MQDIVQDIVIELTKLNQKDWLDIVAILGPIILTFIIIWQNKVYERRNIALQKRIHNKEWSQQYHNEILLLYNTYYEFCDIVMSSGFSYHVKCGNVNAALSCVNDMNMLKNNILRREDLARLLFGKNNPDLYSTITQTSHKELTTNPL